LNGEGGPAAGLGLCARPAQRGGYGLLHRRDQPGRAVGSVGTLLALLLALTVGLFGLRSSLSFQLAPTTLVVESIGTIVLGVTTALVFRRSDT
jgi:hypothetical protein